MYKRLFKDASLYSISTLIARGFSLITVPIYTRLMNPADYGALDLLSYAAVLVTLVMGAALDQAVGRFYHDADGKLEKQRIASTVLFYNLLIFAFFIPFVKPLADWLTHNWLANQVDQTTVITVFVYIWVNAIFYIANNQLKYLFLAKQSALSNIGSTVLGISLGFMFIVYFKLGVLGVFLGQIIGQGTFILPMLYFGRESYALTFHWRTFKRMLAYSLPLVPGTLSFFAMQYVDRYVINEFMSLAEVGVYGIGARLASLVNLFLTGFQGAWSPIVMRSFREKDSPEMFRVVFNYYLFMVLLMLVGLSLFGKEVLLLLTTKSFSEGFIVIPLLVLAAILASIAGYFTYGIQISQKSRLRLYLNVAAFLMNVILTYYLTPKLGIVGAALATVLSFLFMTVIGLMISQRLYYVPYKWWNILTAALLSIIVSNAVLIDFDITSTTVLIKIGLILSVMLALSKLLDVPLDLAQFVRLKANAKTAANRK